MLLKKVCHRQAITNLGNTFDVPPQLMSSVEAFVCSLYGQPKLTDVNEVGYKIFCPKYRDALQVRVTSANYQAAAWRSAIVDIQHFQVIMVMDGLLIPLLLNKILLYKNQVDQTTSRPMHSSSKS